MVAGALRHKAGRIRGCGRSGALRRKMFCGGKQDLTASSYVFYAQELAGLDRN
jgi:hypothetical protein